MSQSINIPTLNDFVQDPTDLAEQAKRNEASTPAEYVAICADQGVDVTLADAARYMGVAATKQQGRFLEGFAFGTVKLAVYYNDTLGRFEVYTTKGKKLAHSAKSAAHAKNGSRNEIVKRQRTRKVRAEKARAAKLAAAA